MIVEALLHQADMYRTKQSTTIRDEHRALIAIYRNASQTDDAGQLAAEALALCPSLKITTARRWADGYLVASGRLSASAMLDDAKIIAPQAAAESLRQAEERVLSTLLTLLAAPLAQDDRWSFLSKIRQIAAAKGKTAADIEDIIDAEGKKPPSAHQLGQAAERVRKWSAPLTETAKPTELLYQQGWAAAYEILEAREIAKAHRYVQRIVDDRPTPYADLKLRRTLLQKIGDLSTEAQDMIAVKRHVVSYLGEAVQQIHGISSSGNEEADNLVAPFAAMRLGQSRLQSLAADQTEARLKRLGLRPNRAENGDVTFDASPLLRDPAGWAARLEKMTQSSRGQTPGKIPDAKMSEQQSVLIRMAAIWPSLGHIIRQVSQEDEGVRLMLHHCAPNERKGRAKILRDAFDTYRLKADIIDFHDAEGQPPEQGIVVTAVQRLRSPRSGDTEWSRSVSTSDGLAELRDDLAERQRPAEVERDVLPAVLRFGLSLGMSQQEATRSVAKAYETHLERLDGRKFVARVRETG